MSPFTEIGLITGRELRKSLRSVKGGLLASLSVAGGAGMAMLFAWLDRLQRENIPLPGQLRTLREGSFVAMYGADTGKYLTDCPYPIWIMLLATLWLAPLLVALMNFDSVSGDLQYRSVRFWTVRTRRASYIIAKFLGAWLVVLAVTLGMNVIVWMATASVGKLELGYVVGWGFRFFAVSVPISAAWCGIATLVGSHFKTPMLSLLVIFAAFFGLWLIWVFAGLNEARGLAYVFPNAYDAAMLSPKPTEVLKGLAGTGFIAVATVAAAALLFERRDV